MAIDAIYSMTAIVKEEIIPFRLDILQVLNHCRFDKIKPVREATLETIKLIKETGPPLDEEQLAIVEDKQAKPSQAKNQREKARSGSKSARNSNSKKPFGEGSVSTEESQTHSNVTNKPARKANVHKQLLASKSVYSAAHFKTDEDQDVVVQTPQS